MFQMPTAAGGHQVKWPAHACATVVAVRFGVSGAQGFGSVGCRVLWCFGEKRGVRGPKALKRRPRRGEEDEEYGEGYLQRCGLRARGMGLGWILGLGSGAWVCS